MSGLDWLVNISSRRSFAGLTAGCTLKDTRCPPLLKRIVIQAGTAGVIEHDQSQQQQQAGQLDY